jgi:hypothetical protein
MRTAQAVTTTDLVIDVRDPMPVPTPYGTDLDELAQSAAIPD